MPTPTENATIRLNRRQREVLSKLAWGWSYPRIQEHFQITQGNLHTLCHQIRQKTGITNTKNAEECRNWQRGNRPSTPPRYQPGPSPKQLEVMRLRAGGMDYNAIALRLGITMQCAQNHCSQGCKRAKIGGAKHNRIYTLQLWLKSQEPAPAQPEIDPLEGY